VLIESYSAGLPAKVVDMRDGRPTGLVREPVAHSSFLWVAAEPSDHVFVLADVSKSQVITFYRLRLGHTGQPLGMHKLNVPALHSAQVYGLALTADGSKLAITWQNESVGPQRSRIEVVSLATGVIRTWSSDQGAAATPHWYGDRILAFEWQGLRARSSGIRLLDTAARGTDPLASRLLISLSTRFAGLTSPSLELVTQDRSTIFADMAGGRHGDLVAIVAFSARTGRPLRIVTPAAGTLGTNHEPLFCGVAWADSTGRHLITQCGLRQFRIDGTSKTRIRIRPLPWSAVGFANTFAW
jgi:hypothetical protein